MCSKSEHIVNQTVPQAHTAMIATTHLGCVWMMRCVRIQHCLGVKSCVAAACLLLDVCFWRVCNAEVQMPGRAWMVCLPLLEWCKDGLPLM